MENEAEKKQISNELKCSGCGSILKFNPGTRNLKCTYCGADNVIEASQEAIEEIDYVQFVQTQYENEEKIEVVSVRCNSCGAHTTLKPNVTSDSCPYCATSLVVESGSSSSILKPKSLIPFAVDKKKASESFRSWIESRWFAPSDLKKRASSGKMDGIYAPYWTYDALTHTDYTGQRGTHYYETETYTTTENNETVTKTRQVRRTRWHYTSGHVSDTFDDVLVVASNSLPEKYTVKLEPWNLKELVPFNEQYLSGFRAETYQVDVTAGLEVAKNRMDPVIRDSVRHDIGGDEQRITTMDTAYSDITFKHVLLPIWISAYRYNKKVYRFLVNGQTGEVQGERPYSALKIALAVLLAIIAIIVVVYFANK